MNFLPLSLCSEMVFLSLSKIISSVIKMKIHANDQMLKNIIWSVSGWTVLNGRQRNRQNVGEWIILLILGVLHISYEPTICSVFLLLCVFLSFFMFEWMQSAPRISNFRIAGVTLAALKWEMNVFTCFEFVSTFRLFGRIQSESWITHFTCILNVKEIWIEALKWHQIKIECANVRNS